MLTITATTATNQTKQSRLILRHTQFNTHDFIQVLLQQHNHHHDHRRHRFYSDKSIQWTAHICLTNKMKKSGCRVNEHTSQRLSMALLMSKLFILYGIYIYNWMKFSMLHLRECECVRQNGTEEKKTQTYTLAHYTMRTCARLHIFMYVTQCSILRWAVFISGFFWKLIVRSYYFTYQITLLLI